MIEDAKQMITMLQCSRVVKVHELRLHENQRKARWFHASVVKTQLKRSEKNRMPALAIVT